jgi:hypothetical protein
VTGRAAERHEALVVERFVEPAKRRRLRILRAGRRRRRDYVSDLLVHGGALDEQLMVAISPYATAAEVAQLLRAHGAAESCHVISVNWELDGRELPLEEALGRVLDRGYWTLLSLLPGRLAYYEGEMALDRRLLVTSVR